MAKTEISLTKRSEQPLPISPHTDSSNAHGTRVGFLEEVGLSSNDIARNRHFNQQHNGTPIRQVKQELTKRPFYKKETRSEETIWPDGHILVDHRDTAFIGISFDKAGISGGFGKIYKPSNGIDSTRLQRITTGVVLTEPENLKGSYLSSEREVREGQKYVKINSGEDYFNIMAELSGV